MFPPNNWLLYLKVGIVIGAFLAGWAGNGWRLGEDIAEMQRQAAEASQRQAMAVLSIERLSAERTAAVAAQAATEAREQAKKTKIITKKVIEYVQNPNTGKCDLPDEWVLAHNAATGAELPETPNATTPPPSAAARTATDRDALIAVTANYAICQDNLVRHRGLIAWAKSLAPSDL